jgi:membrane protease subunit (stomatin/prohibitin family)
MGLFDKLRGEFIDIIEWIDGTNDTMVYRFDRYQNEIKNGAKLTVREGQMAVFIKEGKIADIFAPGMYELTTANLPIMSTLEGWKYGFNSPFKAEVYFIRTANITDQKWGTRNPIILNDKRFGMIEIRAYGTYVMRVSEPAVFIKEIVGTDGNFTADKIAEQLKSMIVARFTDAAGEANLPIENYASNISEISELLEGIIGIEFRKYGIELTKFLIENVSMPEEIKNEVFELSRLNTVDLNKLTQIKAAKALQTASENSSPGTGIGMEFAMANMMGQVFNGLNQNKPGLIPPPVPATLSYYAVINGQQAGPYDLGTLKQMAAQQQLTGATLIWYAGLKDWIAAEQSPELQSVFGTLPPPVPGQ